MNIIKNIKNLHVGKVIDNALMSDYTTYKVGGKVICVVIPEDEDSLIRLLKYLRENNIKNKVLGNGSNVIFNNSGYDGVIIKLDNFNNINIINNKVIVGAGCMLNKLALRVSRLGLTGMEFAAGIPGTVGGAVFMNAGAYKSDMGYIVTSVKVLTPEYTIKTLYNKDLDFHYRTSFLQKNPLYICLEATITLIKGNTDDMMEIINERKRRRMESQPLEYPSAGSVFRNPVGLSAGKLIEDAGLKGYVYGGAKVSEKHANFIVNEGTATYEDIIMLIDYIKDRIKILYNIDLILEQEIIR